MLKRMIAVAMFVLVLAPTLVAADIPARPEELEFPELKYDPPRAKDYRTTLDNGMVAYLAPDESLHLLTIPVLMRLVI